MNAQNTNPTNEQDKMNPAAIMKRAAMQITSRYLPTVEAATELMAQVTTAKVIENGAEIEFQPENRLERMAAMVQYAFYRGAAAALETVEALCDEITAAKAQDGGQQA